MRDGGGVPRQASQHEQRKRHSLADWQPIRLRRIMERYSALLSNVTTASYMPSLQALVPTSDLAGVSLSSAFERSFWPCHAVEIDHGRRSAFERMRELQETQGSRPCLRSLPHWLISAYLCTV